MDGKLWRITHRTSRLERRYVMKKHVATRLHYDLRLEWNGVLLSWALPLGPDRNPQHKQQAIEMADHRAEYLLFEGMHRTGPIMLWDRGSWEPHPDSVDVDHALKRGLFRFNLRAEKLEGGWLLSRLETQQNGHPVWMLCKEADRFAIHGIDRLLEQQPNSVNRHRTMEDIVRYWNGNRKNSQQQTLPFHDA